MPSPLGALLSAPFRGLAFVIYLPLLGYWMVVEMVAEGVLHVMKKKGRGGKKGC